MVEIAIFCFLVGAALSRHFTVFVLVPAMLFAFVVIAVGEGVGGETISWIEIASVLLFVQLGYLGGGILQYAFDERSHRKIEPRTRPQSDPAAERRTPRQRGRRRIDFNVIDADCDVGRILAVLSDQTKLTNIVPSQRWHRQLIGRMLGAGGDTPRSSRKSNAAFGEATRVLGQMRAAR